MDTMTTIEAVELTASGAYKITLLGDVVAGTRDPEIGALAERLAGDKEANPVSVTLDKLPGDKLLIKSMQEILPPEELGGSEESAPVVGEAAAETPAEKAERVLIAEPEAPKLDEPAYESETHALALEEAAAYIRGLQS